MPTLSSFNTGLIVSQGSRANTVVVPNNYITLSHLDTTVTTRYIVPGSIMLYSAASVPTNFLACDGSAVSQTTYANLYAVIGSTYNTGGEGVGNFRLPDLRGRFSIGQGTGPNLSARTMAQSIGAETVAITTASLPGHTHNISASSGGSSSNHTHNWTHWNNNQTNNGGGGFTQLQVGNATAIYGFGGISANHSHSVSGTTDGGSVSSQAHVNVQPSLVLRYCIRY